MVDILTSLKLFAQNAAESIPNSYVPIEDLEDEVAALSTNATLGAAGALLVLIVVAALTRDKWPKLKTPLFIMICLTLISSFLTLAGATIYLNVKSDTGGPVNWRADFEIWACGNELELRDPYEFLSNKIGTSTLYEHDDRRIYLEGVPVELENDATLGKFMYVIGGAITDQALLVPLNPPDKGGYFENSLDGDGVTDLYASQIDPFIIEDEHGPVARFIEGQKCGDQEAVVNVFRYRVGQDGQTYYQEKLSNPRDYVISGESAVP
ncbi:MAG: hypothetical protein R3313_03895, partial [Candidatus Saccharimonadales bacterium]|nr:hypothetical protein [Candidatus Saccharimonadales bacterium]